MPAAHPLVSFTARLVAPTRRLRRRRARPLGDRAWPRFLSRTMDPAARPAAPRRRVPSPRGPSHDAAVHLRPEPAVERPAPGD